GTVTKTLSDAYVSFYGVCGPYWANILSNSVVVDSYQNVFASFQTTTAKCPRGYHPGDDTPSFVSVYKWTNSTNAWSPSIYYSYAGSYSNLQTGQLVPLTSGRLALVDCDTGGTCTVRNYDGAYWSYPSTVTTDEQCNWLGGCSFSAFSAEIGRA